MADQITSKLNPDLHLILDQPFLRLPFELLRKNFKAAHFSVEKESTVVKSTLKDTTHASISAGASLDGVLKNFDSMLSRIRGLKRKLISCSEEETRLQQNSLSRIRHIRELYEMKSLDDVKYEEWSRIRLDRLIVDYLLRNGFEDSAIALANEKRIECLVDVDTFVQMNRIRESLLNESVVEALAWCHENKKDLRRMESNLEFLLRFQQYIELVRSQDPAKLLESISHINKYLLPYRSSYPRELRQACGLLAFLPGTRAPAYAVLYSQDRWQILANLFYQTHNTLLSLPSSPILQIALSAGLSALKTPSCHSQKKNTTVAQSSNTSNTSTCVSSLSASVCPICSTELNSLAKDVPYAHHTKSHVASDLVMLPNGYVYRKQWLKDYSEKAGLPEGKFKNTSEGKIYNEWELKKLFIT
ncbi:Protein FYV10 [Golovinomyces cichoracearum]|uniref:Protein FYV10 n=1 Tax=Golovinomyces cichoracearum TaxID=62708 RepID=A0A420J7A4_9PEZI|nr:Protein FYV10 [Golovinomyces cichoracearum]